MEYRTLGRTPLNVSAICLGSMMWGEQNTEEEAHAQLNYAFDRGVNFIDTAEIYAIPPKPETQGRSEEIIGTWLESKKNREQVIIASKVIGPSEATWLRDAKVTGQITKEQVNEAVDKSLKRLRTDYIDLYQIHWPHRPVSQFGANPMVFRQKTGHEIPIEDQIDAFADVIASGKVRYLGLSNESTWGLMNWQKSIYDDRYRMHSIQNSYNLLNRSFEVNLAEASMRENVGLLAYSPLAQGFLSGKYLNGARPEGARRTLYNRQQRYETPNAEKAISAYLEIAKDFNMDPNQMALQFVTTRPFVTSAIMGATNMEQLKLNLDSIDLRWSKEIEQRINEVHLTYTNPCP